MAVPRAGATTLAAALRVAPLSTLNEESRAALTALARGGLLDDGPEACGVVEPSPPPTPLLTADLLAARHGAPSIACGAPWLADALVGPPLPPPPAGGARARAALLRSLERAAAITAAHAVAAGPPPPKQPVEHPRHRPAAVRWRDQRPLDVSAVEAEAALAAALADTDSTDEAAESSTRRNGGRVLAKLVVDAWRGSAGGGGGALALALRPLRAAAAYGGRARAFDAVLALALHADLVEAPRSGDDGGSGGSDARPLAHHPASPPATAFLDWLTHLLAALLDDAAAAADVTDADWRAAADALAAVATRSGSGGLTARAAAVVPPRAAVALAAAATEGGWPAHVGLHLARLAVAVVYEGGDSGCVDAHSHIDPARLNAAGSLPAYASLLAGAGACPPETRRNIACVLLDGLAAGAAGEPAADAARGLLADCPAAAADTLAASVAGCDVTDGSGDCPSDAPPLATILAALGAGLPPALVPAVAHLSPRAAPRRGKSTPLSPPVAAAVDLLTCDEDRAGDAGRALLAAVLARTPRDADTLLPPPTRAEGDPPACATGALLAAVLASPCQHAATRFVAGVRGALLAWAGVSGRSDDDDAPPPRLATALATVASLTAWLATAPPASRPRACADAVDLLLECVARPHPPPATLAGGGAVDGLAATAAVTRPTPAYLAGFTALPDAVAAALPVDGLRAVLEALPPTSAPAARTPHASRAADARLAALLLLLTVARTNDAVLESAGGMAAVLAAAGDDPRARSAAAATALARLDARRGGELAAALARAGEDAAARGEGGAAPAPAPLLEAAVATGRVAVE